ncbi:hypothetical protein [Paenibacillus cymbidii]|uniref:hypothetical protein n=1 Tax=Paenibacillus cymbidii TaxID=1639034 RepID=UPI0010802962|nr:hypothetical protein [Paenibacillus cymbidii]
MPTGIPLAVWSGRSASYGTQVRLAEGHYRIEGGCLRWSGELPGAQSGYKPVRCTLELDGAEETDVTITVGSGVVHIANRADRPVALGLRFLSAPMGSVDTGSGVAGASGAAEAAVRIVLAAGQLWSSSNG